MFFDALLQLCAANGISITQLALKLGISRSNVTNWKNGSIPKADKISKIASYFGVSTDYLLGNEQKNKPATKSDELSELLQNKEMREIYDILTRLSENGIEKVLEYAHFQREQEKKQNL